MPDVGDHCRPANGDSEPGVYRVVGVSGGMTLLRVADAEGRRVHTGEISRVDPGTFAEAYVPAQNPDAGFAPLSALRGMLDGLYWSVRQFVR
jgi:hypothetical protein